MSLPKPPKPVALVNGRDGFIAFRLEDWNAYQDALDHLLSGQIAVVAPSDDGPEHRRKEETDEVLEH